MTPEEMDREAFTEAARAFGAYSTSLGYGDNPTFMHHQAWAAATAAVLAYRDKLKSLANEQSEEKSNG